MQKLILSSFLGSIFTFSLFFITQSHAEHVYSFNGNPYSQGPLQIQHLEIPELLYDSPTHMTIYYPLEASSYVPIVFVPGLFGVIYAEWYSDVFKQMAAHGYIVIGVDTVYPAEPLSDSHKGNLFRNDERVNNDHLRVDIDLVDKLVKSINWLIVNLNDNVLTLHGLPNVKADWNLLGLGGHSAGCDTILKVIEKNTTVAKAIAFIEPFSYYFKTPLPYSLPALCYGTQYSEEYPKCIYPEFDYRHFYGYLKCPKILMNVTGFGHCDILNEINWATCRDLHFCKTIKENNRTFYRTFIAGVMSAFFGTYLQHNPNMLPFVTDDTRIPTKLGDFKYEINC